MTKETLEKKMLEACSFTMAGAHSIFKTLSKRLVEIAQEYAEQYHEEKDMQKELIAEIMQRDQELGLYDSPTIQETSEYVDVTDETSLSDEELEKIAVEIWCNNYTAWANEHYKPTVPYTPEIFQIADFAKQSMVEMYKKAKNQKP
jgi:hypothetical protein